MNCPYCNFDFKLYLGNEEIGKHELAPVLCEGCAQVSLWERGKGIRQITPHELDMIKLSPAWREVLEPATKIILEKRGSPH